MPVVGEIRKWRWERHLRPAFHKLLVWLVPVLFMLLIPPPLTRFPDISLLSSLSVPCSLLAPPDGSALLIKSHVGP